MQLMPNQDAVPMWRSLRPLKSAVPPLDVLTHCCRLSACPELEIGAGAEFHLAVRGDDNRLPLYLHIRGQHRLCRPLKRVAPVLRIPGADAMQPVERPKLGKVSRDIDMLARLGGIFVRNHNELKRYRTRRDKAE